MPSWDDVAEEPQSGGRLLAYTGVHTDAYFSTHEKGGNKLVVDVLLDNPEDYPYIKSGTVSNWFFLPKGWEPQGNGARAVATEPGKDGSLPTKFWASSPVGQLVSQMRVVDPEGKTLTNGLPQEAAYWKSLGHVRWGGVPIPNRVKQADGGYKTEGTNDVSMPVELLGASSIPEVYDLNQLGASPEVLAELAKAANAATSYAAFIPAVYQLDGVKGTEVLAKIGDSKVGPLVYEALRSF